MQNTKLLPLNSDDLRRLLAIFSSEPLKRRAPEIFHGPKPAKGHPPVRLTDEQVLAIRKMHMWYGMTYRQIAVATGETEQKLGQILKWRNRVHLDPGPRPAADPTGERS